MHHNALLVSAIVPTYNRPALLKRTLMSIVRQSHQSIEILVISNGKSVDNQKIIEEIGDPRIVYFEQENSGGPAAPRNRGIQRAKGKYVAFCDDDDLWMPDKIEKQVAALETHTEYGLCYSKMLRFNHEKAWAVPHEEGFADLQSLLYTNTIPISSVFIKKSLLESYGGFSESKRIGSSEDYEFLLRYATVTKFYFLEEYLIKYWSGNNRITDNDVNVHRFLTYMMQIFSCYATLLKSRKISVIKLILPVLYNLKLCIKVFLYKMFTKIGLLKT